MILPVRGAGFRRRKAARKQGWRIDETYIKISDRWIYQYRAVSKLGQTVDLLVMAKRDLAAVRRFFERAIDQRCA